MESDMSRIALGYYRCRACGAVFLSTISRVCEHTDINYGRFATEEVIRLQPVIHRCEGASIGIIGFSDLIGFPDPDYKPEPTPNSPPGSELPCEQGNQ